VRKTGKHQSHERCKLKKKDSSERKAVPQASPLADQKTAPSASKPVSVLISSIVVQKRLRKGKKATVDVLTESIRESGQLSPIWLRKRKLKDPKTGLMTTVSVLIAGWHRIEAKKALGEKKIDAVYMDVDKEGAMLLEISDNLDHGELTELERAVHIDKMVRLIHARRKAAQTAGPGGRQPGDKSISAAARELGHTRDEVRRSRLIAGISDAAMVKAEALGLDDNQSLLLKIAKQKEPDKQVALAEQLGAKKKRPKKQTKPADKKKDDATYAALLAAWEKAPKCEGAFLDATENAQRKFIRMLQSLAKKDEDEVEDDED
jgi:ParB family transcriptional regulator, chromosome partitioning protein